MEDIISQLAPSIVALIGAFLSLLIVSIKTRTSSLEKALKKLQDNSASQLSTDPNDYVIRYSDQLIPFSDCKVIKKSDLTFDYFVNLKGGTNNAQNDE